MYKNYKIKEIRFLPMSKEEFETEDDVREFLLNDLPKKKLGKYWYQTKGINLKDTIALVLFQYRGTLVGCGIFHNRQKLPVPVVEKFTYHGINHFYPDTIFNIENITDEEFRTIDKSFKRFGQGMRRTEIKYLPQILKLVEKKQAKYM